MHKIYIVNEKGGVGKSTLAFHLSGALARKGSTVLIDSDTMESAYRYYAMVEHALALNMQDYEEELEAYQDSTGGSRKEPVRPPEHPSFSALVYSHAKNAGELEKEAQNFDYMVVDTPARIDRGMLKSIMDSECLVLVPCDTKLTDLWTTAEIFNAFKGSAATLRVVQRQGQQPRAYAREELEASGLLEFTLDTVISTLNAYDESVREGGTVVDIPATPSDRPLLRAKNEINRLAMEVEQLLEQIKLNSEEATGVRQPAGS